MKTTILTTESPPRLSGENLSAISQAPDWEQLRECIQLELPAQGACDFMLKMDISSSCGVAACYLFGTLPDLIMSCFNTNELTSTDPINRHLAKSNRPLIWQVEQLCILNAGQAYPLLKSSGICHGLSMAIRSEHAVSRVDFYSNTLESYPCQTTRQADLLLLGTYLHEATELMWRKTEPNQMPLLSARELECLEWISCGKTSQEVGQILGITQHTVYFHLKNTASKLGVYGSRHAVSRAIMMGIIKQK